MKLSPRRVATRLLALVLGTVLGVAVIEVGIRVVPFATPPGVRASVGLHEMRRIIQDDDDLRYALAPGVVQARMSTTDFTLFEVTTGAVGDGRLGFRDEFDAEEAFGVLVGDSFAMAWGVDAADGFLEVLERATERSFLNFGVVGWGPQQAGLVLRSHALDFRPKVVLWLFFANDFNDAAGYEAWLDSGKRLVQFEPKSAANLWFDRNCAGYKLYKYLAQSHSGRRSTWEGDGARYIFMYRWQEEVDVARPAIRRGLELFEAELDALAGLARERGFTPVLLALGFKEQVYYDEWRSSTDRPVQSRAELERGYHELLEHARSLGIGTLDLTPVLAAAKERQIFFRHDAHLTPEGNRVVGEAVAAYLRERGLLD